jgi:hypothetical protein
MTVNQIYEQTIKPLSMADRLRLTALPSAKAPEDVANGLEANVQSVTVAVHPPSWMEDAVPHLGRERMGDVDLARIGGAEGVPGGVRRRPLDRGPSLLI